MTEFVAQLLWVAIGEYYETRWPLPDSEFRDLGAAQHQLGLMLWGAP